MALLVMIGLAPAQATDNPCFGPTWALSERAALACDFKDASKVAASGIPPGYVGSRTQVSFSLTPLNVGGMRKSILVSNKVVGQADLDTTAAMIGADGGWVDQDGTAHGARNGWTLDLAHEGIHAKAGSLVALLDGQPA
ncbi:hypothetical protein [Paraburkholderia fungorum]|uniref:hypothetical protein n=1 Tax=Paraburkholderia fungorum TaxID=134537 RepID=UPI000FDCA00E|nr:hypothetical protein [Paraburkholderia fungorum]